MIIIGALLLFLMIAIILTYKFNLEGIRVLMLYLLPSFLYAFYGAVIEIKDYSHILESFGFMFMFSLYIMSPALIVFAISMLWIEKKFQLNLLILVLISVLVGGLSASLYLLDSDSFGKAAFITALSTAPIAVLLEGLFNKWRKNRRII